MTEKECQYKWEEMREINIIGRIMTIFSKYFKYKLVNIVNII